MLHEVVLADLHESDAIANALMRHESFSSLIPHLSKEALQAINARRTIYAGSGIAPPLTQIQDDIAGLEKKWVLV